MHNVLPLAIQFFLLSRRGSRATMHIQTTRYKTATRPFHEGRNEQQLYHQGIRLKTMQTNSRHDEDNENNDGESLIVWRLQAFNVLSRSS